MNKITPDHLTRSAYVYVRQSTADQLPTTPRVVVGNMLSQIARAHSAGRMSLSSTMISVGRAVVTAAPASSVCWRRSAPALPAPCWRSRHRGWPATVAIGTRSWNSAPS